MVHGGGHHHHHRSGENIPSGHVGNFYHHERTANSNVVIINTSSNSYADPSKWGNQTRILTPPLRTQNRQYRPPRSTPSQTVADGAQDDCCNQCCRAEMCCCCCQLLCCAAMQLPRANSTSASYAPIGDAPRRRRGDSHESCLPWTFLSLLVLICLIAFSSLQNHFTMNLGETRVVSTAVLNKAITITSSENAGIQVYDYPSCPPLTGPIITRKDKEEIHLEIDDYQYDYFFLNAGSVIVASIAQTSGASNVYVLQGKDILERFETNRDVEDDFYKNAAVLKRFVSSTFSPVAIRYNVVKNDVYLLLYDNASTSSGDLDVDIKIDLTTHSLHDSQAVCTGERTCDIPILPGPAPCIIVQANVDSVDVTVRGHAQWFCILFCSALPIVCFVVCRAFRVRARNSNKNYFQTDPTPPTAPSYQYPEHEILHAGQPSSSYQPFLDMIEEEEVSALPIVVAEPILPVNPSYRKV